MITIETIEQNKDFLDKVAIEVMNSYFTKVPPKSFKESQAVARVAYRQALAMLNTRETDLEELGLETKVIKKKKV